MDEIQFYLPGFDQIEPSNAALLRHYSELGERWEQAREMFALAGDRGNFVHSLNLRWPNKPTQDVLLIVKMLSDQGPVVAFHSGPTWTHLIPTFGDRLRAGAVNFIEDEYPPDDWKDKLTILESLPRIRR